MGFHFLVLKFLIMILWFMILWLQSFSATLSASVFGLAVAEAGWGRGFPLARIIDFGYLSVGQLIASIFAELAACVPRKMLVFEEIVINFANRKSKTTKQPNNQTTTQQPAPPPRPSPRGRGVIREIPLSWW